MKYELKIKLYVYGLFIASIVGTFYFNMIESINWGLLIPILIFTVISETYKIKILISKSSVSISSTLVLSIGTLISLGVPEAIIVNIVSGLISSFYPKKLDNFKILYNTSALVFTVVFCGIIYNFIDYYLYGYELVSSFMISLIYISINYSLAFLLMLFITKKPPKEIYKNIIMPHINHSVIFALIGGTLGIFYVKYELIVLLYALFFVFIVVLSLKTNAKIANKRIEELDRTLNEFIKTLTTTIDARDPYVFGHSLQVSNYSAALATELKLNPEEIEKVKVAGLLHDIGKISISESILFKDGLLTDEEYGIIKEHAMIGENILLNITSLDDVAKLIGMHHERYDGKGYPRGLGKDEIPLNAYILGVADALDALLSDRSYRLGKSIEEALEEIDRNKGTQFHPDVVDALFRIYEKQGKSMFVNSALLINNSNNSSFAI